MFARWGRGPHPVFAPGIGDPVLCICTRGSRYPVLCLRAGVGDPVLCLGVESVTPSCLSFVCERGSGTRSVFSLARSSRDLFVPFFFAYSLTRFLARSTYRPYSYPLSSFSFPAPSFTSSPARRLPRRLLFPPPHPGLSPSSTPSRAFLPSSSSTPSLAH